MTVASGARGAGRLKQLYRRSPVRRLLRTSRQHGGLRPSDVLLASYPRSGSGWLRFMLVELLEGDASWAKIQRCAPYVGDHRSAPALAPGGGRLIKTHEPYRPAYRRAIHLVRDPRDVVVSYFRYQQRTRGIVLREGDDRAASFDQFVSAFVDGRADPYGAWHEHLQTWLDAAAQGRADILRLRYEDLRADPPAGLRRIAGWLGRPIEEARAHDLAARCSIERMRALEQHALAHTPAALPLARDRSIPTVGDGSAGGWRERLTAGQLERFEVMAGGLAAMGYPDLAAHRTGDSIAPPADHG